MSDIGSEEEETGSDDPNSLGFYSWVVGRRIIARGSEL